MLLSHSQICSTIAAEVLNYRVREGNVCDYLAMSTGKKSNKEDIKIKYQVKYKNNLLWHFFHIHPGNREYEKKGG